MANKPTVLFVCVHNAGRSQMAAGFMRELGQGRVEVLSAGSAPKDSINPVAVEAIPTGVPEAIPGVGSTVVELLRGGVGVGQATLTRFYSLHTFVLPLLTAVFMLMHFLMIRKQGISGPL